MESNQCLQVGFENMKMRELKLGDYVRIEFPQTDMEKSLYERDAKRIYKVLAIYVDGSGRMQYARCDDLREDGSSCGVWHFHLESLVPHKGERSTGGV